MPRLALVLVVLGLGGCVISTRYLAAAAAIADAPTCGGVAAAVAVGLDAAVATGLLLADDEISSFDQIALGALAADVVVGGVMALQDCYGD